MNFSRSSASARPSAIILAGVAMCVFLAGCEGGSSLQGQLTDNCRYDGANGANIGNINRPDISSCIEAWNSFGINRPGSKISWQGAHLCTYQNGTCAPQQGSTNSVALFSASGTCRYDGADGANIGNLTVNNPEECRITFSSFGFYRPGSKLFYNGTHICTFADSFCDPVPGSPLSLRDTSPPPQLELALTASETSAAPGEAVSYALTLRNPETRTVNNIFLDINVPKPITLSSNPNCSQLSDFSQTHSNNGPVHPYFRYRCIFPNLTTGQTVSLQMSGINQTPCEYLEVESWAYRGPYDPINAKAASVRTQLPSCGSSASSSARSSVVSLVSSSSSVSSSAAAVSSAATSSAGTSSIGGPVCSDSDGIDAFTKGILSIPGAVIEESCVNFLGNTTINVESCLPGQTCLVTETYCDDDGEVRTQEIPCAYGCSNGACIPGGSSSSSASITPIGFVCPGNECAAGGTDFCATQNATCVETSDLPCLRCEPLSVVSSASSAQSSGVSSSSDDSSASSLACAAPQCILPPDGCAYVGPFIGTNGCEICGTLLCSSSSAQSSVAAVSSASVQGQCQFDECATQNGNGFCAAQGATCTHIPDGACIRCIPLQSNSSTVSSLNQASSAQSSALPVSSASSSSIISSASSSSSIASSVSSSSSSAAFSSVSTFVDCPGGYVCSKWQVQNQCLDITLDCQQGTVPEAGPGCGNVSCGGICMRCVPAASASSVSSASSAASVGLPADWGAQLGPFNYPLIASYPGQGQGAQRIPRGQQFPFAMTVSNAKATTANNVRLVLTTQFGNDVAEMSSSDCVKEAPTRIVCTVGTMAANTARTFHFRGPLLGGCDMLFNYRFNLEGQNLAGNTGEHLSLVNGYITCDSLTLEPSITVNTFGKTEITEIGEEIPFEIKVRLDGNVQADTMLVSLPGSQMIGLEDVQITQLGGGGIFPCAEAHANGGACQIWSVPPAGEVLKMTGTYVVPENGVCGPSSVLLRATVSATKQGQPAQGTFDLREERTAQQSLPMNCTRTITLAVQNQATSGGGGLMYLNTAITNNGTSPANTYLTVDIPAGAILESELNGCEQLSHDNPLATRFLCYVGTIRPGQLKNVYYRWKTSSCGTLATTAQVIGTYPGPDTRVEPFDRRWVIQSFVACQQ